MAKTQEDTQKGINSFETPTAVPEDASQATLNFLNDKKAEMKKSKYRARFDALAGEIEINLMNTAVTYGQKLYEKSGWGSMVFYNRMDNGAYDINVYPMKLTDRDQSRSGVPVSQEPIAFSKIMIATSVLAGKLPDAEVIADDKIYAHTTHFLWKRTWENNHGNGANTLMIVYQNLFTYGWSAWRVYPRRVQVKRNGVDKILFDDIYREPMDVKRTWLGVGFNNSDYWSQGEVYYEKDMPKSNFEAMYPDLSVEDKKKLEYCSVSDEAKDENTQKQETHVTIGYYENVLLNRFVIASGKLLIYDGELPNDDSYGSVVVVRCFMRNMNDPYGVGLYEMMRGNTALYTYLNSLNAQQVEAEISPLLFGSQVQNGTGIYKRGPNIVNPKTPGTDIQAIQTTGNIQGGVSFADKQKENIEANTGVNNIVAGQNAENTLGSTVILKEAAYNRLTPPRNSVVDGLALDAKISSSWIRQIYTVDKIFMFDTDENVQEFVKQNPNYFVQSQDITNEAGDRTGIAVAASENLRLNFDFTPDGEMLNNVSTRSISAKSLFDEMNAHGHKSDYLDFKIDPDSMLLPSMEIQKQTFMALFPVITNQITLIFNLRGSDPDAAASQLMTLHQLLEIQKQDIYKFISKEDYDAILSKQPSQSQMDMAKMKGSGKPPSETLNYKDAPEDVKREIEAQAGLKPSEIGGGSTTTSINKNPPNTKGKTMANDGNDALQPQNPNEVPRPQGTVMGAVDASLGRAAHLPFFPGQ
ncbi:MAG: hypothetical protein V4509_00470 [Patescibacteria group bacterium]